MIKKYLGIILSIFVILTNVGFTEVKVGDRKTVVCHELESLGITVEQKDNYILLQKDNIFMKLSVDDDIIYIYDRIYNLNDDIRQEENTLIVPTKSINLIHNLILYNDAVIDTKTVEPEEILPLVRIDKSVEKIVVGTWHKYPQSYPTGKDTTTKFGEIWVFTQKELFEFVENNKIDDNITLRLEQLIGLPPNKGYTHFSLIWVSPKDLLRPAFNNNIAENITSLVLVDDKNFQVWFNNNVEYSYKNNRYPWTRLGYTYDWANNGKEYGLTEFIIKKDSLITVEKTYSNKDFFELLRSMSKKYN